MGGDIRRKISTFCNVKPECVIENLTMPNLYQCPLMLHTNGLDDVVEMCIRDSTNPLPNSYQRFGCDEAPRYVSWSRQNRCLLYTSRCV